MRGRSLFLTFIFLHLISALKKLNLVHVEKMTFAKSQNIQPNTPLFFQNALVFFPQESYEMHSQIECQTQLRRLTFLIYLYDRATYSNQTNIQEVMNFLGQVIMINGGGHVPFPSPPCINFNHLCGLYGGLKRAYSWSRASLDSHLVQLP